MNVVQRVASDMKLAPHFHALALDGVYCEKADGELVFHALPRLRTDEVADVLLIYYFWESWDGAQIRAAIHRRASPLPATRGEAG